MTTKRKTPDAAVSTIGRYLSQLLGDPALKTCEDIDDIHETLYEAWSFSKYNMPGGLGDAFIFTERLDIRSAVCELKEKHWLTQQVLELTEGDGETYMLVSDCYLTGKKSLFLICGNTGSREDVIQYTAEAVQFWMKHAYGLPTCLVGMTTTGKDKDVFVGIAALQLSSYV
jgi:hypothetical protein